MEPLKFLAVDYNGKMAQENTIWETIKELAKHSEINRFELFLISDDWEIDPEFGVSASTLYQLGRFNSTGQLLKD